VSAAAHLRRHRERCAPPHYQRGIALLVAVLLVALGTIVAAAVAYESAMTARRGTATYAFDQAVLIGEGAEALAAYGLRQIAQSNSKEIYAGQGWDKPLGPLEVVPGVMLEASLEDLQGRFNINNLVTNYDAPDQVSVAAFTHLLELVGLETKWTGYVVDWIDKNDQPSIPEGAEDSVYMGQTLPYRPPNRYITSISELPAFVAHLQDVATLPGVPGRADQSPLFAFGATQDFKNAGQMIAAIASGGFALPDRDQYLKDDERSIALRQQYLDHIQKMFAALGQPSEEAARGARAVLAIETALAKAALDVVAQREPANLYHMMKVTELQALTPHFDWQVYFTASRTPPFTTINVSEPAFIKAMDLTVLQTPMTDLKEYFRWTLLHDDVVMLPARFRDLDFEFFSKALRGQQAPLPRWRQCISEVDERLGEALGKAFVEESFGT